MIYDATKKTPSMGVAIHLHTVYISVCIVQIYIHAVKLSNEAHSKTDQTTDTFF